MKKFLLILALGVQGIAAHPLIEAIDQSDLEKVQTLLAETAYNKKALESLLREAILVKGLRADKELTWIDLGARVAGSFITLGGASLLVDGIFTSRNSSKWARKNMRHLLDSKPDPVRRPQKNPYKIVGGTALAIAGAYLARLGFKQRYKRTRYDGAVAVEEYIREYVTNASKEGASLEPTLSYEEAQKQLEQGIEGSDFLEVRVAWHALKAQGLTKEQRSYYAELATSVVQKRDNEWPWVGSIKDMSSTFSGMVPLFYGFIFAVKGGLGFFQTKSFERDNGVALDEYGTDLGLLGTGMIGMSLGKYWFSYGVRRAAQKKRLRDAQVIEQYITEWA